MTYAGIASSDILGVKISAVDMPSAISRVESWIESGQKQYVCFCTVHGIMEADKDPEFKNVLNNAGLRCPDGMPMVWLSRKQGHTHTQRVCGPDFLPAMCARSEHTGHRHYFYGGIDGVTERLVERLIQRFPDLQVAGWHTPGRLAVGELEQPETIAKINDTQPDIIWVGLGTPKQDWWVANHKPLLNAPILAAVGAAFDFHSGSVQQAPVWMQQHGLEWVYRLSQDPRRLSGRYLRSMAMMIKLRDL